MVLVGRLDAHLASVYFERDGVIFWGQRDGGRERVAAVALSVGLDRAVAAQAPHALVSLGGVGVGGDRHAGVKQQGRVVAPGAKLRLFGAALLDERLEAGEVDGVAQRGKRVGAVLPLGASLRVAAGARFGVGEDARVELLARGELRERGTKRGALKGHLGGWVGGQRLCVGQLLGRGGSRGRRGGHTTVAGGRGKQQAEAKAKHAWETFRGVTSWKLEGAHKAQSLAGALWGEGRVSRGVGART